MNLRNISSTELHQRKSAIEYELTEIGIELILRGELSPNQVREENNYKPLTILTTPYAVNPETIELIREQYKGEIALVLYNWRQAWYANRPKGERLGQAFCNHFEDKIGRGTYTQKLFYTEDEMLAEKLIYQFFIEFNESFYT